MEYLIAIIVGVGLIWAVYAISNKTSKKEKAVIKETEELKIRITKDEAEKKVVSTNKKPQKTLDSIYAESNRLWICSRCETANPNVVGKCVACGRTITE